MNAMAILAEWEAVPGHSLQWLFESLAFHGYYCQRHSKLLASNARCPKCEAKP
jgi:hypothetical protein